MLINKNNCQSKQNIDAVFTPEVIDDSLRDEEAESLCRWAAARAGVIVVAPLVGTMSLIANQVYMIVKIGKIYGEPLSEKMAVSILGSLGSCFTGSVLTTLIPFGPLQIPIAVGTTYALGRVVIEWLKKGKPSEFTSLKKVYEDALSDAKNNISSFKNNPRKDNPLGDENKYYKL